jgi:hypothetical protein
MRTNLLRLPIAHKTSMDAPSGQSRAAASALRRAICDAGLTQEQAGRLVGVDGRQVRRWLANPPPALALLLELEAVRRAA